MNKTLFALVLTVLVAHVVEAGSGGVIATVAGGERPWVVVFPLASDARVHTYSAREPVNIGDIGASTLICVGADQRATVCEQLMEGAESQRRYVLDEGRHVRGRYFVGHKAAVDASVRVRPAGVEARRALVIPLAQRANEWVTAVRTDDTGWFDIEHLAPGKYIFEMTTRSGRIEESESIEIPTLKAPAPDRLPPSRTFVLPEVRLEEGVSLVVEVRSSDGAPIPNASVGVSQQPSGAARRMFESIADDKGVATLDGMDATIALRVSCAAAGFSRFSEAFETLPALVTCTLDKLAKITGTVVDAQKAPVPQATVELLGAHISAVTGAAGAFEIEGVPPGNYTIRAASSTSGAGVREVTIAAGETLDLGELSLGETRSVRGRVVTAATGEPIVGASVTASDPPGPSVVTDEEGFFVLRCDATMQTRVRVAADGYAAVQSILDSAPTIRLSRPGALDFLVWDDETGELCAGCTILASRGYDVWSDITDGEGRGRLDGLAPGDYHVTRERVTSSSRGVIISGGWDTQTASVRANETTPVEVGSQRPLVKVVIDPAPAAEFALRAHGPQRFVTAAVSRPGVFSFRARPKEAYELRLGTARCGVVVGHVGAEYAGQVLSFQLGNSAVQLRITKNDAPAAGLHVRLVSVGGTFAGWAITDANGFASIPYLRPDSYSAIAEGRSLGTVSVLAGHAAFLAVKIE